MNILNLLQYDIVRENRENDFKAQIAEKEKTLQETKSTAEALSKKHSDQLELLEMRVNDLESAKEKEKTKADEAEKAVEILQQTLEMAKVNATKSKFVLEDLSTENDTLKSEVQMLKDLRAKDKDDIDQRIDDAKERATDKALYRVWTTNPRVLDLAFLREKLESTMAQWKVWLEEEVEDTVVEAVDTDEEAEIESLDLKTAQVRLDALMKNLEEASREDSSAEPEVSKDQPAIDDASPAEDAAQP